jgi:hypothetical protein
MSLLGKCRYRSVHEIRHYARMTVLVIDELVEQALRELADETTQTKLWLASSGPEVSSLTECRCQLWDDSGLGAALEKPDVVYTPEIDRGLHDLRVVLRRIDDQRPPQEVLEDPQLAIARSLAQRLLRELRAFGYDRQ